MNAEKVREFARRVKGDGCIVRYGRMIHQWGEIDEARDWASASKPVLTSLILCAVQDRLLSSVHAPVAKLGWPLEGKDRDITFHHLASMTSGYGCPEAPGKAWAYNDLGIELLAQSLERVFHSSLEKAAERHFAPLRFQDGAIFGSRRNRGVALSPRDMARLGLLWLNEGEWQHERVLSRRLFQSNIKTSVPPTLPRSIAQGRGTDYLGIGSYGGGVNQTAAGPGYYGFCFWFNTMLVNGRRVWPCAPRDTFQANGAWNAHTVTMIPSLHLVIVCSNARKQGAFRPGISSTADTHLKLLMDAVLIGRPKKW